MAIFKVFLRVFATFFIGILLLVNLSMFSTSLTGINPLGLPTTSLWDFDNYYFGFSSIITALGDMGDIVNFQRLLSAMENFFNTCTLRRVPSSGDLGNDIVAWLAFLVNIITFPVMVLADGLNMFLTFFLTIIEFLQWFTHLFNGQYNMPLRDTTYLVQCGTYLRSLFYLPRLV